MQDPTLSSPPTLLKIIGIGHAGIATVERLAAIPELSEVELTTLDMDQADLMRSRIPGRFCFGMSLTRGLGAGGDPSQGRSAAESDLACLRAMCAETRIVILVAGLGGGAGTGAAPVIARQAREAGALVLAVVTLPFDLEGSVRIQNAAAGLRELRTAADAVIVLPNARLARLLDERTPMIEVFNAVGERFADSILGLWKLLARPGLLPVDFAALERLVRGRNAECACATVIARGEHRTREAMDRMLTNAFLDDGRAIAEADALLIHIAAGADLTLAEVERVARELKKHYRSDAQVVLGASIERAMGDTLELRVIATRKAHDEPAPTVRLADASASPGEGVTRIPVSTEAADLTNPFNNAPGQEHPPRHAAEPARPVGYRGSASRRRTPRPSVQPELNLFTTSTGHFANTPATIHENQNLDEPTFLRRNLVLN